MCDEWHGESRGRATRSAGKVILSLPSPPAAARLAARPSTCRPARRASGGTALPPRPHTSPAHEPSPPTPARQGRASRSGPLPPTTPPTACSPHRRTATTAAADAPTPRMLPRGRPIRGRATRGATWRHLPLALPTFHLPRGREARRTDGKGREVDGASGRGGGAVEAVDGPSCMMASRVRLRGGGGGEAVNRAAAACDGKRYVHHAGGGRRRCRRPAPSVVLHPRGGPSSRRASGRHLAAEGGTSVAAAAPTR